MNSMLIRFLTLALLAAGTAAQSQPPAEPPPTFESLLKKIAPAPADPCDNNNSEFSDRSDLKSGIFEEADKAVVAKLNASPIASPSGAKARATEALQGLQRLSAEINKGWPEDNRFQFEVIEVPPALVAKMTLRTWATFSFFGMDDSGKTSGVWQYVGALDDHKYEDDKVGDGLEIFPLQRGPAKRVRFLARFDASGCAGGSAGVSYYAYEWNPEDSTLDEFIKIAGAYNLGYSLGAPQTKGPLIHLPYCWFSAVDTWDNPSLCATDSYDLSGDHVRFLGSKYNMPDLVALANAIKYAEAHDYPATLAYCGSPDVARRMVRDLPPYIGMPRFDKDPNRPFRRISATKEAVDFDSFHFEIEKRADRWLVVSFRMD